MYAESTFVASSQVKSWRMGGDAPSPFPLQIKEQKGNEEMKKKEEGGMS